MADFFAKFPTVNYPLEGYGSDLANILIAILPQHLKVDSTYVYQKYTISGSQSAMSVADQLYGDSTLEWTIYVINNIINPYTDWPMSDDALYDYTQAKYDADPFTTVHHYEDARTGRILDDILQAYYQLNPPDGWVQPVTNFDVESRINNANRNIIVVNPKYITFFVESYNKAVSGQVQ